MARKQSWQYDYWLLLMQQYLLKPVGIKPVYNRDMVALSLELHIPPAELHDRLRQLARLDTPRIERLWRDYGQNPKRLQRAVSLLRSMKGFNSGGDFYEGVEVEETFERDFRPLAEDGRLMPVALIVLLNLYFHLTPATMVSQTPEVQAMAKLLRIPVALVIEVLEIYQQCDPQLNRREVSFSPLLLPCQQVWQRYGDDPLTLEDYATQLTAYYQ